MWVGRRAWLVLGAAALALLAGFCCFFYASLERQLDRIYAIQQESMLEAIGARLEHVHEVSKLMQKEVDARNLALSRAFARMVDARPRSDFTPVALAQIAQALHVDGLAIVGADGIVSHSNMPGMVGRDMREDAEGRPFAAILQNPGLEVVGEPTPSGEGGRLRQLIGVGLGLGGGYVQIAYDASAGQHLKAMQALQRRISRVRVGQSGYAAVLENGVWVANPDEKKVGLLVGQEPWHAEVSKGQGAMRKVLQMDGKAFRVAWRPFGGQIAMTLVPQAEYEAQIAVLRHASLVMTFASGFFLLGLFSFAIWAAVLRPAQARERALADEAMRTEAASQAKSTFFAKMSHEIRTPMNAIIGMAELARRSYGSEEGKGHLDGIDAAGRSLLSIVNDILDFSKIEAQGARLFEAPYETAESLAEVLAMARAQLAGRPIRFSAEIAEALPCKLHGDVLRVRQIMLNLLSNAIKYTKEGEIAFLLDFMPETGDSIRLRLSVRDTGIGIREEDLPHLFADFARAGDAQVHAIGGTGLGLAITRSLARMMGGDVGAESVFGEGSTFCAEFLQKVVDPAPMGKLAGRVREPSRFNPGFSAPKARVLAVDDLAANLAVAKGLLALYGIEPILASSGAEAVAQVAQERFDLVFMDHLMPGMDGVEATARIRQLENGKAGQLAVVALTANAVPGQREMFLQNGFDGFLPKPIELPALDAALVRWIPSGKQQAPLPEAGPGPGDAKNFKAAMPALLIEGVDVEKGLVRLGGDFSRYWEFLGIFLDDARKRHEKLLALSAHAAPSKADCQAYALEAHTLRSALATLGAANLADEAAMLEKAGNGADIPAVRVLAPLFAKRLSAFLVRLEAALAAGKPQA